MTGRSTNPRTTASGRELHLYHRVEASRSTLVICVT